MVDSEYDIRNSFARSRQQHLRTALGLLVPGQGLAVAKGSGVVDDEHISESVGRVVNVFGLGRVDHLHGTSVDHECIFGGIGSDRPRERAMDRVDAQKRSPLFEVLSAAAAHDDCAQAQLLAAAFLGDEFAGHEASDAAKTIEHNVYRFGSGVGSRGECTQLVLQKCLAGQKGSGFAAPFGGESSEVE